MRVMNAFKMSAFAVQADGAIDEVGSCDYHTSANETLDGVVAGNVAVRDGEAIAYTQQLTTCEQGRLLALYCKEKNVSHTHWWDWYEEAKAAFAVEAGTADEYLKTGKVKLNN